jgi:hypothetical protein
VDLLLLEDLTSASGQPAPAGIREAIEEVFAARAAEAVALGRSPRAWPATLTAYR